MQSNIEFTYKNKKKQTIDNFLLKKKYSPNNIYDLIKYQNVSVNGEFINRKDYIVNKNEVILVKLNDEVSKLPYTNKQINVIYEDKYILIVEKEAGIDIEPTKNNYEDNLACYVNDYYKKQGILSKIHFVNRLDKPTSGLVILAKNQYIHNLFKDVKITKKYKALVEGIVKKRGTIIVNIEKDGNGIKRIVSLNGKKSITKYNRLKIENNNSLVDVKLVTGRTHQIRVSFSYINHPLLGDGLYGSKITTNMFLKAYYLKFKHPITNKLIKIKI